MVSASGISGAAPGPARAFYRLGLAMAIAIRRLPQPFDRNMAEQAINDVLSLLSEAGPDAAVRLEEPVPALVAALAGNSPYLRRTMLAHPSLLPDLVALGPDALFARELNSPGGAALKAL
ncbi:MAG: hypothetical protein D6807_04120 [Alphaproteobacteria bacterium]|nr:MAG: hypothetical protein D6807_04120 [Alphaproteobacteria bacterium]